MKILFILNDAPYGSEKTYNALRMAMALQKEHEDTGLWIFLLADAVTCAVPNQSTAQGYYNVERMLRSLLGRGAQVKTCGTCSDARGIKDLCLIGGVEMSTMSELAQWVLDADRVITF